MKTGVSGARSEHLRESVTGSVRESVREGDYRKRKALRILNDAIGLLQTDPYLYRLRAFVHTRLHNPDAAVEDLTRALDLDPICAEAYYERGQARMFMGQLDRAIEDYTEALRLKRDFAKAYSARAGAYVRQGHCLKALDDISRAVSLHPSNVDYLHNRGVVLTCLKWYGLAIKEYEKVIRLRPESAGTYNNLAWIYASAEDEHFRDCRKAIEYARKAVEKARNPGWMDTLARAYAECGEFALASTIEWEAYKLSDPPNELFRKRAEEYKKGVIDGRAARKGFNNN